MKIRKRVYIFEKLAFGLAYFLSALVMLFLGYIVFYTAIRGLVRFEEQSSLELPVESDRWHLGDKRVEVWGVAQKKEGSISLAWLKEVLQGRQLFWGGETRRERAPINPAIVVSEFPVTQAISAMETHWLKEAVSPSVEIFSREAWENSRDLDTTLVIHISPATASLPPFSFSFTHQWHPYLLRPYQALVHPSSLRHPSKPSVFPLDQWQEAFTPSHPFFQDPLDNTVHCLSLVSNNAIAQLPCSYREETLSTIPLENIVIVETSSLNQEALQEWGYRVLTWEKTQRKWLFSWDFLKSSPQQAGAKGGIFPIILNTAFLIILTILLAIPLGLGTAIFLVEYAKKNRFFSLIRLSLTILAGLPGILFGIFGFIVFVDILGFGMGLLSGVLTMTIMILPILISAFEQALMAVPQTYRFASLALGGTRVQTVFHVVLPTASPTLVIGVILGVGRVLAETAAVIFTMGSGLVLVKNLHTSGRVLTVHLYMLMQSGIAEEKAFQTAIVLFGIVFTMNLVMRQVAAYMTRRLSLD